VLRLIRHVAQVGHAHGMEVCVCGEMASQPLMAYALMGLGLRTLSVAPRSVPAVKRIVRGVRMDRARDAAEAASAVGTARDAERLLHEALDAELGRAT
jgi:phosphotransferase system enzyme I (PtsI)